MGRGEIHRTPREDDVNNTTFPAFGTWYSRYASIYTDVPAPEPASADVTELHSLPRLTAAA